MRFEADASRDLCQYSLKSEMIWEVRYETGVSTKVLDAKTPRQDLG